MSTTMIEVKGLVKKFANLVAVDNISFTLEKGDVLGFLGPNGAGKSTTMKMLTSYLPPSDGTASICNFDIVKNPIKVREKIGYLPEVPPLYMDMTVDSYLKFVAKIKGLSGKESKERLEWTIEKCALKSVRERLIANLSKGYKQRVGLAQAIIHNPPILILDEPTIGLDPLQIKDIRSLIKELAADRTIILSTHILPEVTMICNRVLLINQGKILLQEYIKNLVTGKTLEEVYLDVISREAHEHSASLDEKLPDLSKVGSNVKEAEQATPAGKDDNNDKASKALN